MCLIVRKPAGVVWPLGVLRSAAKKNPDGIGWMYHDGAQLRVGRYVNPNRKAYKRKLLDVAAALVDHEVVLHLRMATHGTVSPGNCHPFKVIDGLYMMHNGVLDGEKPEGVESDTVSFIRTKLRPLLERDRGLIYMGAFMGLLEEAVGTFNRLVFMDGSGWIGHINYDQGLMYNGCWLSNTYAWGRSVPVAPWWEEKDHLRSVVDFDYSTYPSQSIAGLDHDYEDEHTPAAFQPWRLPS